jgi:hypothetical protein
MRGTHPSDGFLLTIDRYGTVCAVIATSLMPRIRDDLHRRVELVPMDGACDDITVALYLLDDGRTAVVHSYAKGPEVDGRLEWLAGAMRTLAEMAGEGRTVSFRCGAWHEKAARRTFLEAAKLDASRPVAARPLSVADPRFGQQVTATPEGGGAYRITSVSTDPATASRASAVAAGLVKLAEVEGDAAAGTLIRFACGASHDALVALLLPRAINVRSALREQEMIAARGVLLAPSAQQQATEG